jgi:hypothetical protein
VTLAFHGLKLGASPNCRAVVEDVRPNFGHHFAVATDVNKQPANRGIHGSDTVGVYLPSNKVLDQLAEAGREESCLRAAIELLSPTDQPHESCWQSL